MSDEWNGYSDTPIDGLVVYSVVAKYEGGEDSPFIYAMLDSVPGRGPASLGGGDRCLLSGPAATVSGTKDVGPAIDFGIGSEVFTGTKRRGYFGKDDISYLFERRTNSGREERALFSVDGHQTGLQVPPKLLTPTKQPAELLEQLLSTSVLDFSWEPDLQAPQSQVVTVGVASYNGHVATAKEWKSIACYLEDDGHAQVDLSEILPSHWDHHFLYLSRTASTEFTHPDLGRLHAIMIREVGAEYYRPDLE